MDHATTHPVPTSTWAATPAVSRALPRVLHALVRTDDDVASFVLRLTLGLAMLPHGAQKLLGWFGGYGFAGTMEYFTGAAGLPYVVALLVIVAEFFGALGLVTGLFGRVAALGIGAVMTGAILTVHLPHGFFMNWTGQQAGEGFEYHLLALGIALALVVKGSGALSLDRWLTRRARG
jgi:putative oxidoreductase